MAQKIALIIGAGPAGLTAAYELLHRTDILPILCEKSHEVGGLARTITHKGNRMDIGGHRFFSKSDRVLDWWKAILPIEAANGSTPETRFIHYQNKQHKIALSPEGPDPQSADRVLLVRKRKSRIFFLRKFFDYPLNVRPRTLSQLGWKRTGRIAQSYISAKLFPIRPEKSLRDFIINRFGKELYVTFFRSYTEKVWGVPCHRIRAEWGKQRIKGLSLTKAVLNQVRGILSKDPTLTQKMVETSLIEYFLYPKYGPGQMWQEVAERVQSKGAQILFGHEPLKIQTSENRIASVHLQNRLTGEITPMEPDYLFSTMPASDLIACFGDTAPPEVQETALGLVYRDFITVGVLLKKMQNTSPNGSSPQMRPGDNWIYIQERDVKMGRIQIFNNWSPYLVKDPHTTWVGAEYFCTKEDDLWNLSDDALQALAVFELEKLGMIAKSDVLDGNVVRAEKAYPAYFGTYDRFDHIREFTDRYTNLFLIGRNGMHRYNNQDHSMLAAMVAVDNIVQNIPQKKDNIWSVNTEDVYHESK